jgi:hypothetical protein
MNAQVATIERKRVEPKPKPAKLICVNGKIIADAVVVVSEEDVNWWRAMAVRTNGVITVERKRTPEERKTEIKAILDEIIEARR